MKNKKIQIQTGKWAKLANESIIKKTIAALKENGIDAYFVKNGNDARKKVLELLPKGAEVMDMTSVTLDALGISKEIQESGNYNSVRKKLMSMDRKMYGKEMQKISAAPDYVIGSVHAVTRDGKILVASNSGSQLPAYAYSSGNVIWVIGIQKIVKNLDEGFKRIYEHSLPLESERAKKAYGVPGSFVSKILIVNKEINSARVKVIFVNEVLGF